MDCTYIDGRIFPEMFIAIRVFAGKYGSAGNQNTQLSTFWFVRRSRRLRGPPKMGVGTPVSQ